MDEESMLALEAYERLYAKTPRKHLVVKYSGRFRDYGANVTSTIYTITFKLSKEFLEVDEDIRIGVMQYLLTRLYKSKGRKTIEMDMYNTFLKKIGEYSTGGGGVIEDAQLQVAFDEVNQKYLHNYMLAPNIKWGGKSLTHLGHYTFSNDTVSLSTVLKDDEELLRYVLYHELLHKKHKFEHSASGRTRSHTKAFREDERKFVMSSGEDPEKALTKYLTQKQRVQRTNARKEAREEKIKKSPFIQKILDYF